MQIYKHEYSFIERKSRDLDQVHHIEPSLFFLCLLISIQLICRKNHKKYIALN